ncbi:MAG: MBL fold metallo-hydrolase [Candidatus Sumerlaeia bacterium]
MADFLRYTNYGAARTTTGSRHMIELDGKRILMDCGLYQGRRAETRRRNVAFDFDAPGVDAVLLSHAHIDHSGNIPNLVKNGFAGPIYATPATTDLCRVMLRDSAYIQEKDAEWINKRNRRRKRQGDPVQAIYTIEDAEKSIFAFRSIHYHQRFEVMPNVQATFYDAGHILGASGVVVDVSRDGKQHRLVFSGDIGRAGLPLLRNPEIPHDVDWLIMEGTYGNRKHDPISQAKEELRQVVDKVVARGGKIIVPSFSVERTQEIVYFLNELFNEGALAPIPIYVDSPLAVNVTDIFRLHPECFDGKTREILEYDDDIFGFDRLSYVRSVDESKALNNIHYPAMIISASGMCEAGRILHHLRNSIEDHRNCIMFVGYQAEGTLGRKIVERNEKVNIFGEPYTLRAEVATLNTMSGHADMDELFHYAKTVKEASPNLKRIFMVHGEEEGLEAFSKRLREELKVEVTVVDSQEPYSLLTWAANFRS